MYISRIVNVLVLFILINKVKSICEKTHVNECEKVSDVDRFGQKTWENLVVSPHRCKKTDSHTLDEVLPPNAFSKVFNIDELIIVEKITGIDPGAFNGLKQLSLLRLYKNEIKIIPRNVFTNLHIYKLDLQNNGIEYIAHELFQGSTISIINLSHNKLNNIQVNMLNLRSLEKIIITHNEIQSMAGDCFHENLEHLNMAHNSISQITEDVLKPLKNLKELNLSHNKFKGISLSYGLPSLETLDLSHNQIVVIEEGSFQRFWELKHLKLNHNYLTSISHKVFSIGNSITRIHLHYNAFMYIQEINARLLQKLEEFTIGGNPWACPCLQIIQFFAQANNITQPDCDLDYFSVGKSAVCVITKTTCTFDEKLNQNDFQNFQNSLSPDLCSDL